MAEAENASTATVWKPGWTYHANHWVEWGPLRRVHRLVPMPKYLMLGLVVTFMVATTLGFVAGGLDFGVGMLGSVASGSAGTLILVAVLERARQGYGMKPWSNLHEDVAGRLAMGTVEGLAGVIDVLRAEGLTDAHVDTDELYWAYPSSTAGVGGARLMLGYARAAITEAIYGWHGDLNAEYLRKLADRVDRVNTAVTSAVKQLDPSPGHWVWGPRLMDAQIKMRQFRPFLIDAPNGRSDRTPWHCLTSMLLDPVVELEAIIDEMSIWARTARTDTMFGARTAGSGKYGVYADQLNEIEARLATMPASAS